MAQAGKPQMKVAFNEWGLQASHEEDAAHDPFSAALIAADYLLEMFRNDVYQACYWNLNVGPEASRILRTSDHGHTLAGFNPVADIFRMYAHALNKKLLVVRSSDPRVYGFATIDLADKQTELYLLNKAETAMPLEIHLTNRGMNHAQLTLEAFASPGELTESSHKLINSSHFQLQIEPSSFNRIILKAK